MLDQRTWGWLWAVLVIGCSGPGQPPPPLPIHDPPDLPDAGPGEVVPNQGTPDAGEPDAGPPDAGSVGGGPWGQYRAGPEGTWHNPGTFTAAQARALTPAWTAELGAYGVTQPVRVGDTLYVTMGFSAKVLALDAATGRVRWERVFPHTFRAACSQKEDQSGFYAAPAVYQGAVYVAAPDGALYALDAATGRTLRQVTLASVADPPEFIQSSPVISPELGALYVGVGSVFKCASVGGRVIAVDLETFTSRSVSLTAPGMAGASVWSSISVDAARGELHVTTGDPHGNALASIPYAQAFLRLDARTLEVRDSWQNPTPAPEDNSDFGASPTLYRLADGTGMVAAANKDGVLYALRREALAAGPAWTRRLALGGDPLAGLGSLVAPTFARGTLYAAGGRTEDGAEGSVLALDPATGAVRWRHTPPGFVMAGMPLVGDVLVVESTTPDSTHSSLELLDASSGEALARFDSAGPTYAAPTVSEGLVLWLSFEGTLRAYRIPAQ
ncbi:PQQ-binding-like beta-propeller repeat protein [Aggregicoccus sp. 17bor-14]|uniref:outer membrane protein assembly factor BamB family protein n=1 Tax=Myxococcaceae TaxID=31 RepID=UPI00129C57F6|nr:MULTISPECIES: PQQ-binding-like beta-propeller repeat protein [Myxococcaceae]MBF5042315.1 PQQ-binding-like beta-propeller repeat protein [Simulacricoccus sp. 17bor-14]MRI88089.1 PQQ-binding-like beta-propeller repeat protein [Aggregicoccus sp. 17bor-14]